MQPELSPRESPPACPLCSDGVREREKELDTLDRVIDQGVTSIITKVDEEQARELLACLKFIIDLERIGDLLLNCSNRAAAVGSRIELQDIRDLTVMASRLEKMLGDVHDAFSERDLNRALAVLRSDAELDRLRNLIFMRHLENHDGAPRQESFHVLFMTQSLERAGDHAKNLAEEVCHLVSGHSVRHVLAHLRQAGGADVHRRPEAAAEKHAVRLLSRVANLIRNSSPRTTVSATKVHAPWLGESYVSSRRQSTAC